MAIHFYIHTHIGVRYSAVSIVKKVFEIEEVQQKFKETDNVWRILYWLYAYNRNDDLCKYIISALNISNVDVIKMMDHKVKPPPQEYPKGAALYHRKRIIQQVVTSNQLQDLQRLIAIITEKVFIQQVFITDDWNVNVLEKGILFVIFKFS